MGEEVIDPAGYIVGFLEFVFIHFLAGCGLVGAGLEMNTNETDKDKARQETYNLVPAPAVKLMKSRVLSRPGENSDRSGFGCSCFTNIGAGVGRRPHLDY